MKNTELAAYGKLYDIVADNMRNSGAEFRFSKEQFLTEVGQAPQQPKGIAGNLTYYILKICKSRTVQKILQKMPKWILNIGRKLVG